MRIPSIPLAILFGLTSLGAAPAADQSQPTPSPAAPSVKSGLLKGAAEAMSIGKAHPANVGEYDRDKVCYTMRSYIVSRENRDSDSTKLVGYSTCQPSSKYELRITVEDPKE